MEIQIKCGICMEKSSPSEFIFQQCGHGFHPGCINEWNARAKGSCPVCRRVSTTDGIRIHLDEPEETPDDGIDGDGALQQAIEARKRLADVARRRHGIAELFKGVIGGFGTVGKSAAQDGEGQTTHSGGESTTTNEEDSAGAVGGVDATVMAASTWLCTAPVGNKEVELFCRKSEIEAKLAKKGALEAVRLFDDQLEIIGDVYTAIAMNMEGRPAEELLKRVDAALDVALNGRKIAQESLKKGEESVQMVSLARAAIRATAKYEKANADGASLMGPENLVKIAAMFGPRLMDVESGSAEWLQERVERLQDERNVSENEDATAIMKMIRDLPENSRYSKETQENDPVMVCSSSDVLKALRVQDQQLKKSKMVMKVVGLQMEVERTKREYAEDKAD